MTFDDLRTAVSKVDALAHATEELFDNTAWSGGGDTQRLERIAQLVGATAEAADQALVALDSFNADTLPNPATSTDSKADDWG